MMNKRITKRDRRRLAFKGEVYKALRDLQDGKVEPTLVCAGKLSDKMTVVYDRIVKAAETLESK